MHSIRLIIQSCGGLLLALLGVPHVSEVIASWGDWLTHINSALKNPYIYAGSVSGGIVLLTFTGTEILVERRLTKAGGPSKREFPAKMRHWDKVQNFAIWQLAWLWNDLEPIAGEMKGTIAYSTFRSMKEDLSAGKVKDAQKVEGSWLHTTLSRQQLIDYAANRGERPKFLFSQERRLIRRISARRRPVTDFLGYQPYWQVEMLLFRVCRDNGIPVPNFQDDLWVEIKKWLVSGEYEGIARPIRNGLKYEYIRVSRHRWRSMKRDWNGFECGGQKYADVMLRKLSRKTRT